MHEEGVAALEWMNKEFFEKVLRNAHKDNKIEVIVSQKMLIIKFTKSPSRSKTYKLKLGATRQITMAALYSELS